MKAYCWVHVSGRGGVHLAKTHLCEGCLAQLRLDLRGLVNIEADDPDDGQEPCYNCERDRLGVK